MPVSQDSGPSGPMPTPPSKDQITPHKVALAAFIRLYYTEVIKKDEDRFTKYEEIYGDEEESGLMISLLNLIQSADVELKDLMQQLHKFLKPLMWSKFRERLRELASDNSKNLMVQGLSFTDVFNPDAGTELLATSVLGLFCRRMRHSFEKLSFCQVTRLHARFKQYHSAWSDTDLQASLRDGGAGMAGDQMFPRDTSNLGDSSFSIMDVTGDQDRLNEEGESRRLLSGPSETGNYSGRQAELFIANQAGLIQHNEQKAMNPRQLQQKITELLGSNPCLAQAHYLSFLNHLRMNEYCGAMESLYHYYDRRAPGSGDGVTSQSQTPAQQKSKIEEDPNNIGTQYAALNLAALHFKFGHHAEALAAIQETIQLAQENNDHVCLQHALSWLQRLCPQGQGDTAYILDRLVNKAGELNLSYLTSMGVQSFSKHNAFSTAEPSSVFEFLVKSDIVNIQHSLLDLMCTSYAQKSGLWRLYGRREMCSLASQLMLNLNTIDMGVYHSAEAECLALCQLAKLHADQGDFGIALLILEHAKKAFPPLSTHSAIWMLYEQQLMFEMATHQCQWDTAEQAITNMAIINPLEALFCKATLLYEKGQCSESLDIVQKLLDHCDKIKEKEHGKPELVTRILLLQGALHCSSGNASDAVEPLLSCLTLAKEHHFSYTQAMAKLHLAHAQYCLGLPGQALKLLEEILVVLLAGNRLFDQARAQYLRAKCGIANSSKEGDRKLALCLACQRLIQSLKGLEKLESHHRVKNVVYFQARLYHELEYPPERNRCALKFKELDQQYPTWTKSIVYSF